MKVFAVTLTTHTTVLMEATDGHEARACMKARMGGIIHHVDEICIEAEETKVTPENQHQIIRA